MVMDTPYPYILTITKALSKYLNISELKLFTFGFIFLFLSTPKKKFNL